MVLLTVSSNLYNKEYFLNDCDGYMQFITNLDLNKRLQSFIEEINLTKKDKIILDLGCGRGEVVNELSKKANLVIGVDYSKDAINLAKNKFKKKNTKFIQLDVKKLPFKNDYFDLIISSELLEHLYSWEQDIMFKEIRRVLKPGGRVVMQTEPNKLHRYFSSFISIPLRIFICIRYKTKFSLLIERPYTHTIMHVNELSYYQAKKLITRHFKHYSVQTKEMVLGYNKLYLRFFFNLYPFNNLSLIKNLINREIIINASK